MQNSASHKNDRYENLMYRANGIALNQMLVQIHQIQTNKMRETTLCFLFFLLLSIVCLFFSVISYKECLNRFVATVRFDVRLDQRLKDRS